MKTIALLPQTFFRRGLAALASIVLSHSAGAAIIMPLDQWPTQWTTAKSGGDTVIEMVGEKLVIQRPGEGNSTGGIAFWNGNQDTDGVLGSFSGSVVLSYQSRSNDVWGVLVGAQSKTFTNDIATNNRGFYIGIKPNSPDAATNPGGLYIWENFRATSTSPSSGNAVATGEHFWSGTLDTNTDFLLEFSVTGATIEASLWNLDQTTREKGSLLASLTHTHTQAVTGYFGLEAFRFGNPTSRTFSELKLEIIPEPGSAALGGVALLTWLVGYGVFRRRA